jgi:hypothetical protein
MLAQDNRSNQATIRQLRTGLMTDGPHGELQNKLDQLRQTMRIERLRCLNSITKATDAIDSEILDLDKEYGNKPVSIERGRLDGLEVALIGYSITYGGAALPHASPVVEAFRRIGSSYEEVAYAGQSLDGSSIRLEKLNSPIAGEIWIFAHGQQSQVMQYHEKMCIYSFDGYRLRELWSAERPLKGAEFKITKDVVRITYEDEAHEGPLLVKTIALTVNGPVETP